MADRGALARRKWRRWISVIVRHTSLLVADDFLFLRAMDSFKSDDHDPQNGMYRWIRRTYATHGCMGVRRLLDKDRRTYSLLVLVGEIVDNSQFISRKSFVHQYPSFMRDHAHMDFDKLAGVGNPVIPRENLIVDRELLLEQSRKLKSDIDKRVAHSDRDGALYRRALWSDLHDVVVIIERIACRYDLILRQSGNDSLLPGDIQKYQDDWEAMWGS